MIQTIQTSKPADYTFSIVIPTWNNLEMMKLCIKSIQENSTYKHQIIIHANESKDDTLEWLKENFDGDVTYSRVNTGVCYPLNYCAKLALTDYYCFFNDDMYALPNWDKPLVDAIKQRKDNQFFYSATQIQPFTFWDKSILAEKNYGTDVNNFKEHDLLNDFQNFEHDDWSGATWPPNVVHLDVWHQVGGYSIEYSPGMYSDPDFSMKLWKIGIRDFKGFGQSRVYHFESKTTKRIKKNKGAMQFLAKWGISNRAFGKYYLKRGEKWNGALPDPTLPKSEKVRSKLKTILNLLR